MFKINLRLFSGGGASSGLGGGGRSGSGDSKSDTYRFTFITKDGKEHTIDVRGETLEKAKEYLVIILRNKGIKQAKITKVRKQENKQKRIADNVVDNKKSIVDDNTGNTIDLSGTPLSYTNAPSNLDKTQMDRIKDIAAQIRGRQKERLTAFDNNGNIIFEKEGTATEVSVPTHISQQTSYDIHNHTRESDVLGGTFSVMDKSGDGDMVGFAKYENKRITFASAKEGVYYIAKRADFNANGFLNHMRSFEASAKSKMDNSLSRLEHAYESSHMGYKTYMARYNKIKNRYLVEIHNEYLKKQKTYGYTYGLFKL